MKYNTYLTIKKSIQYPKFGGVPNVEDPAFLGRGHRTQPIQPEFILEKLLLDLETEDPQIPRSTLSYRRSTSVENALQIAPFYAKQSQFSGCPNERKVYSYSGL